VAPGLAAGGSPQAGGMRLATRDVAKHVGASAETVSRAVGFWPHTRPEVIQRVRSPDELGRVPNGTAR
jgi:DNA-binding LacI/PurR family transcriptional regulator